MEREASPELTHLTGQPDSTFDWLTWLERLAGPLVDLRVSGEDSELDDNKVRVKSEVIH